VQDCLGGVGGVVVGIEEFADQSPFVRIQHVFHLDLDFDLRLAVTT
jgi:hypothetical protein